jgi:hypothetical protein
MLARVVLSVCLLFPIALQADSLIVTDQAFIATSFSGDATAVSDFQGRIIAESPELTLDIQSTSFMLSLGYFLPPNSVITAANLSVVRISNLTGAFVAKSTPLVPSEEFGCSTEPCPFEPATPLVEVRPGGPGSLVTVGGELLEIQPWIFFGFDFNGETSAAVSETETFFFDLLALGWADALTANQLLQITGSQDLSTVRSFGDRGIGAQSFLHLDATHEQLYTATLEIDYSQVPEPATWLLVASGALAGIRRKELSQNRNVFERIR